MPPQLLAMVAVETRIAFRRATGIAALGVAFAVGLLAVTAMRAVEGGSVQASSQGMPVEAFAQFSGPHAAGWALTARNFFVLPLVLLLATGSSVAGELSDHTLREQLVRPVPRWAALGAKVTALALLALATLLATLVPALAGGAALFGMEGPLRDVLLGYLASWASDIGLVAIGVLASVLLRSTGGVVVGVVLFLMLDLGLRGVLKVAGMIGFEHAKEIGPLLPGAALAAWEGWKEGWAWQPFLGLAAVIAVCLGVALVRFERMDVP